MGHIRLHRLPDTVPWHRVVEIIAEGQSARIVAAAASEAATKGLKLAEDDEGVARSVLLLAQVVIAARQDDFKAALDRIGIHLAGPPDTLDIVCRFTDAIDAHLRKTACRTDVGEIAQLAAVESLTGLLNRKLGQLFDTSPSDVKGAFYDLSTKKGFETLAHEFFSRFTQRFLTYHLGRELSNHVGGNGRFSDPEAHTQFVRDLELHSREAARIAKEYAGDWYSKGNFEGGITPRKATKFANHVLKKLRAELVIRGGPDGQ